MSRKEAINAKCKECIYDKDDKGTVRQQIAMCTSRTCPLFGYRPSPIVKKGHEVAKTIVKTNELAVLA